MQPIPQGGKIATSVDTEAILAKLHEESIGSLPKLYAMYGVFTPNTPYRGWVLEFPDGQVVMFEQDEDAIATRSSLNRLVTDYGHHGEVRLVPVGSDHV